MSADLYIFMCSVPECMFVHHVHAGPAKARRGFESLELNLQAV